MAAPAVNTLSTGPWPKLWADLSACLTDVAVASYLAGLKDSRNGTGVTRREAKQIQRILQAELERWLRK